jgi:hypothetical protein
MSQGAISSSRYRDLALKAARSGILPLLIAVGALVPSVYVVCHALRLPNIGSVHDDAIYWVTAKSIAEGRGYRLLYIPGEPRQLLYPPLYPLLLSGAWKIRPRFPDNAPFALWSSWLMLPLLLVMTDRLAASMGAQPAARMALPVWIALNPIVISYSVNLMSELMFCCMLTACLWMITRSLQPGGTARMALFAGLVGGLTYLTRIAGIFLLAAAIVCYVSKRSYRKAVLFAAGMLPALVVWQIWTGVRLDDPGLSDYRSYLSLSRFAGLSGSQLAAMAGVNIKLIFLRLAGLLVWSSEGTPFLQVGITCATLAMVVYCLGSPKRPQFAAAVVAACYLGMLSVWPDITNSRLLLPAVPVLLAIFVSLSRASWIRNPLVFVILGVAGVFSGLVSYVTAFGVIPSGLANLRRVHEQNQPVYDWLRVNSLSTPLVTDSAALVYLHTGRPALEPRVPVADWYLSQREADINFRMRMLDIARSTGGFLLAHCRASDRQDSLPLCSASVEIPDIHLIADTGSAKLYRVDLRGPR